MSNNEIVQLKSYDENTGQEIGNVLPITNSEAVKTEDNKTLKQKLTEINKQIEQTNASLDKNVNYEIISRSTFDGITKKENIFSVLGGIDSLTNGAGTSNTNYGYYLEKQLWSNYGFGGYGYVGFQNNTITKLGSWNYGGFKTLEKTDQSQYPGKYSLDNKGCYADNADNAHIYFYFKNKNQKKAKVIYLKQPNGGSFDFSWIGTRKKININTDSSEYELGVTDADEENLGKFTGVACSNCNGKLVIFGVYLYNEKGAIFTRLGKGGDKLINHAKTDDGFREKWLDVIKPDIYLFNGGANDKNDWDGETYLSYLTKYLTPFLNKNVHTLCIRCNDIGGDDRWNNIFEPVLEKFSKGNGLDYISDKKILGNYQFAKDNGYMLDGIHPNEKGNKKRANFYASYLNLPTVNFNNETEEHSTTALTYQYNNKLTEKYVKIARGNNEIIYRIGIVNAYTIGLLTLNVLGQRNGSNHMVDKTFKLALNNTTVENKVTNIGNLKTIENYEYSEGPNPTVNFNLTANIVNDLLEISITPNTGIYDMNFYIKGEITMTYLTVKGKSVWEN